MATNNSSIVSKRSVERLYYPEPHFIRYFVKKPIKRSPLINKGYWLRMWAISATIEDFLQRSSIKRVVLNLGCGASVCSKPCRLKPTSILTIISDPTPFRFLSQLAEMCSGAVFVDVDHGELMKTKTEIINRTPQLRGLLSNVRADTATSSILLHSDQYVAIGCDLRNLSELDRAIKAVLTPDTAILCVAEVSITYMELQNSDSLISWAAGLPNGMREPAVLSRVANTPEDVIFCLLEQCLPDGPDHPFAKTMLNHFEKLRSPLRSVQTYQTLKLQEQRFLDRGWCYASAISLWDVWSTEARLSPDLKRDTEPFDEWEEFGLFACHYFILLASNKSRNFCPSFFASYDANEQIRAEPFVFETCTVSHAQYTTNPKSKVSRHHAALIVPRGECVGAHGGMGLHSRLSSVDHYSKCILSSDSLSAPPSSPRLCHSITELSDGCCLLVGGRTSPTTALADCWLLDRVGWKSVASLPSPRYRHCASPISCPKASGLLIFGGKSNDTQVHDEWLLWEPETSWRVLHVASETPRARFGASIASLGPLNGVLFGGMDDTGLILDDFWHWNLVLANEQIEKIELRRISERHYGHPRNSALWARFGASAHILADRLYVVGGIGQSGYISRDQEIISTDLERFAEEEPNPRPAISECWESHCIPPNISRPLLVGHCSYLGGDHELLIVGGGAVCFSFGTFWNAGSWTMPLRTVERLVSPWKMLSNIETLDKVPQSHPLEDKIPQEPQMKKVRELMFGQALELDFESLLQERQPGLLKGLELGPCVKLWTSDHMGEAVGLERAVRMALLTQIAVDNSSYSGRSAQGRCISNEFPEKELRIRHSLLRRVH